MNKGGNAACVLNAANEIAVDAFLKDKIKFLDIAEINAKTIEKSSFIVQPTYEDFVQSNQEARQIAFDLI